MPGDVSQAAVLHALVDLRNRACPLHSGQAAGHGETPEAQLTEGALEEVAGGGILEDIAAAVIKAITPEMPTVY